MGETTRTRIDGAPESSERRPAESDEAQDALLPVWTRAVVSELLTNRVMPLDYDLLWANAAWPAWRHRLIDELGFAADELPAQGCGLVAFFDGYAYVNASLLRLLAARNPLVGNDQADRAYLGHDPQMPVLEADSSPAILHDQVASFGRWLDRVVLDGNQAALETDYHTSVMTRRERPDLIELSDRDLWEHVASLQPLCRRLFAHYLDQTLAVAIGPGMLATTCDELGLPGVNPTLIAGLGGVDRVAPAQALWCLSRLVRGSPVLSELFDTGPSGLADRLAEESHVEVAAFAAGLEALAGEVGFIGGGEWELASPTWESEPALMLSAVDWLRSCPDGFDPSAGFAAQESQRITYVKQLGDLVASQLGAAAGERFTAAVSSTEVFVRGRERAAYALSRAVNEIRLAVLELGGRATARRQIDRPEELCFLFADELRSYARGELAAISDVVAGRRNMHERMPTDDPPFVIDGLGAPPPVSPLSALFGDVLPMEPGEVLLAEPGAPGRWRGVARVLPSDGRADRCEPGDIAVARATATSWLPHAMGLGAIVMESGTMLSSAAVVGRELGVAVVVGALDATARIPDGALIEVDGETGIVTLIEPA